MSEIKTKVDIANASVLIDMMISCESIKERERLAAIAQKDLVALEAKANAFDALEGLVDQNKGRGEHTCITRDGGYCIISVKKVKSDFTSFGQGPDLQSAINDAVGKENA